MENLGDPNDGEGEKGNKNSKINKKKKNEGKKFMKKIKFS